MGAHMISEPATKHATRKARDRGADRSAEHGRPTCHDDVSLIADSGVRDSWV